MKSTNQIDQRRRGGLRRPADPPRRRLYTVSETEQVILTQFGKPVGGAVTNAGLHFKIPFIQEVNRIEKRVLRWDGRPSDMPTKDKTYIVVDAFGRWRISDPKQLFPAPARRAQRPVAPR